MTAVRFLLTFMAFLGFLGYISTLEGAPKIIEPFDFAWLVGSMIAVVAACVYNITVPILGIAIPTCPVALGIWGIGTIFNYLIVSQNWVKLLIFTPLIVVLSYLMLRLARGGG